MRLPAIEGIIDRRILVNYRVDPLVIARLLPPPFRPLTVGGKALAGICLIRLRAVRPRWLPPWLGVRSENAAHRVAVEWKEGRALKGGVFIFRRDTNSRLSALAGGRVFPGRHHYSRFEVRESRARLEVAFQSRDGQTFGRVTARVASEWPGGSVFGDRGAASAFFAAGSVGYSPAEAAGRFQGLELHCHQWQVTPLELCSVQSSLFDNENLFPRGSIEIDCGLLMRGIAHEWRSRADLCCSPTSNSDLMTSDL
jgi:uncharacterized protein YqjF (DUF2071 family)